MDDQRRSTSCPICSTPAGVALHFDAMPVFNGVTARPLDTVSLPFTLNVCPACGFVFQNRNPEVMRFLDESYQTTETFLSTPLGQGQQGRERLAWWLATFAGEISGRVLEIGCATGDLLAALAAHGCRAVGVDPSPQLPPSSADGSLTFVRGLFPHPEVAAAGPYDTIVSNLIVEHIADVDAFFGAVVGALAPGGRIVFSVPDNQDRLYAGYAALSHQHLNYFTAATLTRFLRRHQFGDLHYFHRPDALYVSARHGSDIAGAAPVERGPLDGSIFARQIERARAFAEHERRGGHVVLMGACGAAVFVLQAFSPALLEKTIVADSDPIKDGRFLPHPITLDTKVAPDSVDAVIIVPWGYQDRMVARARELWGDKPLHLYCRDAA